MFGRRATFGKSKPTLSEIKQMRPTPDSDGVTRVLSKEHWNDPKIGAMLQQCGFAPDDPRNIPRTADDYADLIEAAFKRLQERVEAFDREMTDRHGYCRAAPFLIIDLAIWEGEHGAFLSASMDLVAFDDWNVLMLAADVRTKELCGLAGHPGPIPTLTDVVAKRVIEWKARYESALDAYGITATAGLITATRGQGKGITREEYEAEKDAVRREIVDQVASMKPRIVSELLRIQG